MCFINQNTSISLFNCRLKGFWLVWHSPWVLSGICLGKFSNMVCVETDLFLERPILTFLAPWLVDGALVSRTCNMATAMQRTPHVPVAWALSALTKVFVSFAVSVFRSQMVTYATNDVIQDSTALWVITYCSIHTDDMARYLLSKLWREWWVVMRLAWVASGGGIGVSGEWWWGWREWRVVMRFAWVASGDEVGVSGEW